MKNLSRVARILLSLKSYINIEEHIAVERIITRLNTELKLLNHPDAELKYYEGTDRV